jgi:hypothetical protein
VDFITTTYRAHQKQTVGHLIPPSKNTKTELTDANNIHEFCFPWVWLQNMFAGQQKFNGNQKGVQKE